MNDKIDIGKKLFDIFSNNWNEIFLFDGTENRKITYQEFFTYILKFKEKLEILNKILYKNGNKITENTPIIAGKKNIYAV